MTPHRAETGPFPLAAFGGAAPRAAGSWRREEGVFDPAELGWLAEQARRRVNLELGWPDGPALLRDLHERDEAFRRLATHPRLLARGTAMLGAPVAIAATALFTGDDIRLPAAFLAADAVILVPLAPRHPGTPGAIELGARLPETARADWPFLIALRRAGGAMQPAVAVDDDALWPDAASVAG